MKTIRNIIVLIGLLIISCGKDDGPSSKDLVTPSMSWKTTNVFNEQLEISVTVQSVDDLPSGKIELLIDNSVVNSYIPTKGIHTYLTNFRFNDTEEHIAIISYSFNDGRPAILKQLKLKKVESQSLLKSTKYEWVDL